LREKSNEPEKVTGHLACAKKLIITRSGGDEFHSYVNMKTSSPIMIKSISFTQKVKQIIKKIPRGKVATYGQIAAYACSPRAVRQVVWILNSSSRKDKLPWHRVINRQGKISLKPNHGYEIQKMMLEKEGVKFDKNDVIDFERYLWTSFSGSRRL